MKLIKPSYKILTKINGEAMLKRIEAAGRTCYKSEDKITADSAKKFVASIMESGHESVIEHESVSVRIICDRGVTHEIVRHRLASYSQESTRYCNYSKDKFGNQINVIDAMPYFKSVASRRLWIDTMMVLEGAYAVLIKNGEKPQMARSVLPNSLKTEIVMTCNVREWRHFFKLRTSNAAHPQMREIACPMLDEFKKLIPVIFDDINYE
jgi:thymidylate synthase (FAD)